MTRQYPTPEILYEDNHLLVVVKPPNIPVQADASGDDDLLSVLKRYIKQKYDKPGEVYLGLVHRLDRPVGGVMVFARTSKAAKRLSEQFAGRTAKKHYAAVVTGEPEFQARLEDWLLKGADNTTSVVREGTPEAKRAALWYRLCARRKLCLLNVELQTGRSHQIRVQLANAGLPIWGDARYNPTSEAGQQIALWAYLLCFEHPTTKQPLRFVSLPKNEPFDKFAGVLASLSGEVGTLYEDEDVLAVRKPVGMGVSAADGEGSLEEHLSGGYDFIKPAHRLDVNTGGIVLFAKNAAALEALETAFKNGEVHKSYVCVAAGSPKQRDRLTAYAVKDAQNARVTVLDAPCDGAKTMITGYELMRAREGLNLLRVELFTGRTHQIRAQLAHAGLPLLGDDKYGDWALNKRYNRHAQLLWAAECTLQTQGALKRLDGLKITSEPPFDI